MSKTKNIAALIISFFASIAILFGVYSFDNYLLMSFPLTARMVLMIVTYWLIAAVSAAALLFCGHRLADYGCTKEKLPAQIGTGVALGAAMSLVLTVIPHLAGFGDYVSSNKQYTHLWQFIYDFVFCIIAIGLVEELVFRGTIYEYAKRIFGSDIGAVILSSLLFGAFHILRGNIAQIIVTAFIGALFCLFRLKIKNCSLLSLIIAHGIYDALIVVWTFIFGK